MLEWLWHISHVGWGSPLSRCEGVSWVCMAWHLVQTGLFFLLAYVCDLHLCLDELHTDGCCVVVVILDAICLYCIRCVGLMYDIQSLWFGCCIGRDASSMSRILTWPGIQGRDQRILIWSFRLVRFQILSIGVTCEANLILNPTNKAK